MAQVQKDSVESIAKRAYRKGLKLISTNAFDTIIGERSIDAYTPYAGRIIRHIHVERVGFERSIYDSAKNVAKTVTKIANSLHVNTRERTIVQHLFIAENSVLNPHRLADNERFLRDKDFILDSRIVVIPVEGTDSVDISVITRDVFSLGGKLGGTIPSAPIIGVYDANVDGRAQRIEFTTLIDQDRTPKYGYSLLYRKSSILGSLTNFEVAYTQLNTGYSIGDETEFAGYIRAGRPLVSPYSRLAGGGEVSLNWSKNVYKKPDSVFLEYKYSIYDVWLGYNIGIRKEMKNRKRQFLAFRYFNGYYIERADPVEVRDMVKYSNSFGYLSEFTLYRRDFYKTRYVFGFGRTEDIPSGFSIGLTTGYVRLVNVDRPYGALQFGYGQASRKGNFYQVNIQTGGYLRDAKFEDAIAQGGIAYYTKLWQLRRFKIRSLVSASYTQLINHNVIDWLKINRAEIPGFRSDSLRAAKRFALHLESEIFTPWSFLGFRFAPFGAVDMVPVDCVNCVASNEIFWGFTSGLRTRNENLIFGTLELKLTYIPSDEYGQSRFVIGFKQNLRVKNTGIFASEPTLIPYN